MEGSELTPEQLAEARKVLGLPPAATDTPYDVESTAVEEDAPKNGDPFYCPGCGRSYAYQQKCVGTPEQPHKPIEVVSTDELSGDPANHTPAPNTDVVS